MMLAAILLAAFPLVAGQSEVEFSVPSSTIPSTTAATGLSGSATSLATVGSTLMPSTSAGISSSITSSITSALIPTSSATTTPVTGVYYNSTDATRYTSTTIYTAPASPPPNPFDRIPDEYTSEEIPAPLNRHNEYHNPSWTSAYARARSYLSDWTIEEKVQLTTGAGWQIGRCLGNIPAIPSRGFPGLCLQDSPLGVRLADFVSAFPAGHNIGMTFDKDLMYARGKAMGEEHKGKGVNVVLGPATDMARQAAGGRNWESFGGDPYLSGWAVQMTVKGLQDTGVQSTVKHYVANNQERRREQQSSNMDDRTMREIYSHPFLRGVYAGTASVMASYNLINGSWASQNAKTLNGILKTDFGFEGYVMSDWQGTHSGVLAVSNGLDMTMPGDILFNTLDSYFGNNLTVAVYNGSVSVDRLDDMAERIIAGWFLVGQDEGHPVVNFDSFRRAGSNNSHVDVRGDHDILIRRIAAASTVLLKNVNNTLPLRSPRSILLAGSDMGPSPLGPNGFEDRGGLNGTLAMGWGSGTAEFPYLVDPLQAMSLQARKDRSVLDWWFDDWDTEGLQERAVYADVVIVGIHSDSGEYYLTVDGNIGDRNNLSAWNNGDEVVLAAANVSNNVVVVIHTVGPIDMEKWIDHPNVTAVLWAGLPGQESGNGLVDILYGAYNPSARLSYTIAKNQSDYPAQIEYVNPIPGMDPLQPQVNYTEGIFIDYRHFQYNNITPRYEFGYGLSYTSFNYTNLQVEYIGDDVDKAWHERRSQTSGNRTTVGRFLSPYLQDPQWRISVDVQNVGGVYGCDVPQLYLSFPPNVGEPPRVLRDFARVNLEPWQAKKVEWTLNRYDTSIWDTERQEWSTPKGEVEIVVAKSSSDKGITRGFCPSFSC